MAIARGFWLVVTEAYSTTSISKVVDSSAERLTEMVKGIPVLVCRGREALHPATADDKKGEYLGIGDDCNIEFIRRIYRALSKSWTWLTLRSR